MRDYIDYIDFRSIKLGDVAYEVGDYKLAYECYCKALERLKKYQGDRMQPISMAGNLSKKIETLAPKQSGSNAILKFETWQLSKSSFVKGERCTKYLFLDKHKKNKRTPFNKEKLQLFKKGHSFESHFRESEFPNGINIKEKVGNFAYFNSYTKFLLDKFIDKPLYEATIIEDGVLVMCDVLSIDKDGQVDIYEVKLNYKMNDTILNDLAIQYYVCKKRFGGKLRSFNLVLVNNDDEKNYKTKELSAELDKQIDNVNKKITGFKSVLKGNEPVVEMGNHCHKPYDCEFIKYCENLGK